MSYRLITLAAVIMFSAATVFAQDQPCPPLPPNQPFCSDFEGNKITIHHLAKDVSSFQVALVTRSELKDLISQTPDLANLATPYYLVIVVPDSEEILPADTPAPTFRIKPGPKHAPTIQISPPDTDNKGFIITVTGALVSKRIFVYTNRTEYLEDFAQYPKGRRLKLAIYALECITCKGK